MASTQQLYEQHDIIKHILMKIASLDDAGNLEFRTGVIGGEPEQLRIDFSRRNGDKQSEPLIRVQYDPLHYGYNNVGEILGIVLTYFMNEGYNYRGHALEKI